VKPGVTAVRVLPGGVHVSWEVDVTTHDVNNREVSDPVFDSEGNFLVAASGLPDHALLALSPSGETKFSCEIPTGSSALTQSTFASPVALLNGRWAVVETIECTYCLIGSILRLRVFDTPGELPATHGWMSAAGGASGAARPLP
jgi:hypothetical protein